MPIDLKTPKERARSLLEDEFSRAPRIHSSTLSRLCREHGVSITTFRRAAQEMGGVTIVHGGPAGTFWERAS